MIVYFFWIFEMENNRKKKRWNTIMDLGNVCVGKLILWLSPEITIKLNKICLLCSKRVREETYGTWLVHRHIVSLVLFSLFDTFWDCAVFFSVQLKHTHSKESWTFWFKPQNRLFYSNRARFFFNQCHKVTVPFQTVSIRSIEVLSICSSVRMPVLGAIPN